MNHTHTHTLYTYPHTHDISEVTHEVSEQSKEKASLDQLQKAYTELNSRKIKDPLSSFLPDIPGEIRLRGERGNVGIVLLYR